LNPIGCCKKIGLAAGFPGKFGDEAAGGSPE
jgi:hypothetical protein